MPTARTVQPLPVAPGTGALQALAPLARALAGEGPALLPVAADNPAEADRLTAALAGEPALTGDEDTADDPTALVIATSGSTGTPKGVLLAASALRASAGATHRRLGGPGHWLLAMPAHHIAGIQVLVRALLAGTRPHAVDTTGGFRPDRFAEAAREVLAANGPHYTALVPTQLSRLVSAGGAALAALREFDAVLLGGAATPPALLARAVDSGVRVTTTYGMSETSGGCVYDGRPLDITRVRIDGGTGPIHLAGPMVARGYRNQPGAAAFADGWFRTGDIGRWRGDRLEVLGRADDMIITGGVNVAPLPVERVLTEQHGVREVCVLGVADPEWGQAVVAAVVPTDPAAPPPQDALRAAVKERISAAAAPKRIVFLPELPLRGPGKPDRRALAVLLGS
ncbi:O-succinylbenzoic acid--CoA ligase [Saccharopolyspora subtropica]|uniref:O-succinylbenzoate--CoA ligase n=1 Tax=Saccharopolyspora thermophila TaxID=89367 RepID=A0A917NEL8_9PSEU|nr:o-succinylbenzoate--CoA ligase [Saccharopolyspora subtropica]GGI93304.1 O-succinylbenzoic acid--CoA ligase [Saccharopolyspora subtropica]